MEYVQWFQSLVGLQHLLWLYNPILKRQTLLQFLQTKSVFSSAGAGAELCCLRSLLSPHCSSLFLSLHSMAALTVCLQLLQSAATASQPVWLMSQQEPKKPHALTG